MADEPSPLDALFHRPGAAPNPGARDWDIEEVELRRQCRLPGPVRELYRRANGGTLTRYVSLLTLREAEGMAEAFDPSAGGPTPFGLFPLTENNDSNPICVVCNSPLAGYVVHVFHDNDPRVLFRSAPEFFAVLARFLSSGGEWLEELASPFDAPGRTENDRRVGRELIALAGATALRPPNDTWAYYFATDLLGADDVPDLAQLLAHRDEYVREAAERRLGRIGTPAAADAVRAYHGELRAFARRVREALRAAGLDAHLTREGNWDGVRVEPGPVHLNLPVFFGLRDEPGGFDRIVRRVRELVNPPR